MNQFFTEVKIPDWDWKLDYHHKIMMMGSCFAENMGQKLEDLKFQIDQNPFGILYNPESIAKSLRRLMNVKPYAKDDLFEHSGIWNSFDHHSRFSSVDPEEALETINNRLQSSHQHLKEAEYLFITFGTSWVYELKQTGEFVSNCHKLPAKDFKRFRLTPGEIAEQYKELIIDLLKFNSNLKILFTVSPIRHWKDGAVENQLSKASLLLAVDRLVTGFGNNVCNYFPSYEIMMDELRDYRFYAADLLHPNEMAIDHIWDKFNNVIFSDQVKKIVKDVLKLNKAFGHRPFNSASDSYKKFLLYNLNEIERLTEIFPFLNFTIEQNHFRNELSGFQSDVN